MAVTTYGGVNQRTTVYAASVFLEHAEPQEVFGKFGSVKPMPKNKAETIKFRRSVPFPKLTVELAEGITPTSRAIQFEDVSATMQEWGDVVEASDRVRELSEDPIIKEASKLLGEQATETTEGVMYGVLKAGTQVGYAGSGITTRLGLVAALTLNNLHQAVRVLNRQRAKFVTEMMSSSVNYDTRPIEAGYIAIGHTDLEHDIRALAGFIPVAKYGSRKPLCQYELGSVENVRFILTVTADPFLAATTASTATMVAAGGAANDVYPLIIFGRDAFAQIPLKGSKAVEMFVWTGGDKSDPLNQRDVIGAKYWFTAIRLNENWMYRLETLATKL